MAQREKGGRVVFIGNIPYGISEEQICEIFGRCGSVVSFRLVYDKETGKPKGFGFLEYTTADSAATAVRNLNEFEIGGRTLRVDYSNDNDKGGRTNAQDGGVPTNNGQTAVPMPAAAPNGSALPPLPAGVEIAPGLTAPEAISRTLSAIPAPQLLDIMSQMKGLVASDPQKAAALLTQAPQLSYALFQALLLLGLVETHILSSLIATTQNAPVQAQAQAPPQPIPQAIQPPPQQQQQFQQQMPAGFAPLSQQGPPMPMYAQPGYAPPNYATPPPFQAYQPPAPVQQQPQYGGLPPGLDASQAQTVMSLTRDQLLGLDEASRDQIIQLRVLMHLPPIPAQ